MVNSYLEAKYTRSQLFRGKILENNNLDEKNTGTKPLRAKTYWNTAIYSTNTRTQLFREKIYWDTAIKSQNILGHSYLDQTLGQSYLEPKHTAAQLFRAKT